MEKENTKEMLNSVVNIFADKSNETAFMVDVTNQCVVESYLIYSTLESATLKDIRKMVDEIYKICHTDDEVFGASVDVAINPRCLFVAIAFP